MFNRRLPFNICNFGFKYFEVLGATTHSLQNFLQVQNNSDNQITTPPVNKETVSEVDRRLNKYNKKFFWIKKIAYNKYAFGINPIFIKQFGAPKYLDIYEEIGTILDETDVFGNIENEKVLTEMTAPFDGAYLYKVNTTPDFYTISQGADNIDNWICIFKDTKVKEKLELFKYINFSNL